MIVELPPLVMIWLLPLVAVRLESAWLLLLLSTLLSYTLGHLIFLLDFPDFRDFSDLTEWIDVIDIADIGFPFDG